MGIGLRHIIVFLVLLALPASSYFTVFKPQNKAIEAARQEIDHKRELLEKLREETARNADLARANEEIASRLTEIEARLPSSKELDLVVRRVSDIAVRCGLAAPVLNSATPVEAALYREQPLEMKITGTFDAYYKFLLEIEKMPRITRIPDLRMQRVTTEDGVMSVEFTLSIYFQEDGRAG
ncbi:MAG: type 4a pilus biogenesis protein PilO [Thermoleophilia bacterium]|nr:type 4a pilus biogenesis protein PilO [Thermoleophilia bacterium]